MQKVMAYSCRIGLVNPSAVSFTVERELNTFEVISKFINIPVSSWISSPSHLAGTSCNGFCTGQNLSSKQPIPMLQLPVSFFQFSASGFLFLVSSFQLPVSSFQIPVSSFQISVSSFQLPVSSKRWGVWKKYVKTFIDVLTFGDTINGFLLLVIKFKY